MTPTWWEGLLLGLVQGLTEFLPVSSSGHLVLAQELIGFQPPGLYFEVGLHLATLLSVLIAYGPRVRALARGVLVREGETFRYLLLLVVASVPAALAGLFLRDFFAARFQTGVPLGVTFLATAGLLWSTRWARHRAVDRRITARSALIMGVAQAAAILPALSRSGATITAGLWARVAPVEAAEFSFLMSVIVVAGSGLIEARHLPPGVNLLEPGLLLAFLAALLSGIWAIRFLVALLQGRRFYLFAWYCTAVGLFTLGWSVWTGR